ncbi:PrpF protein [Myxozyma melibiosi]|uniref:PrpF protein n=1 Tax=Myxozyma melibiosi TaxID=54550 RepID=A0ABR1FDJ8_9ASCO
MSHQLTRVSSLLQTLEQQQALALQQLCCRRRAFQTSSRTASASAETKTKKYDRPQNRLPAAYYRGGTSRAIMFNQADLPESREAWAPIFTGTIGSPDSNGRQLDGMGGGISSLSKICVVGAPAGAAKEADVDYTFAQVEVRNTHVDYASNCGNMSAAIGPFAYDWGLVDRASVLNADKKTATVRIHNTNTRKIIHSTFPVIPGAEAVSDGEFAIDGVSGTAAKIQLDFINPGGSKTGKLLPSGNVVDVFDDLPGFDRPVSATLIDAANPVIFINADAVGLRDPAILPDQLELLPDVLARLETIRNYGALKMGFVKTLEEAQLTTSVPKICVVSRPVSHILFDRKTTLSATEIDVVVRAMSVGQPHRAIPITVALATAAAARLEGSVVHDALAKNREPADKDGITIGHSSGKIVVGAKFEGGEGDEPLKLAHATVYRTARRLFEGVVYWK